MTRLISVTFLVSLLASVRAMPQSLYVRLSTSEMYPKVKLGRPACIGSQYAIEVLRLDVAAQRYELATHRVPKALNDMGKETASDTKLAASASAAVTDAIEATGKGEGFDKRTGAFHFGSKVVLVQAEMRDGEQVDMPLEVVDPSGHLVYWNEAHYERRDGPQRWTEVFFSLGEEGSEAVAEALKQQWVEVGGTTPYAESMLFLEDHVCLHITRDGERE
eukprot:TRINITY_DN8792_c0_g1_i2.p1 TRINITY_DN8792_c0_g1~~TRINITY_DN8792_c0_g1_i2.p1  ORF type:complete len:232 (+),score=50.77 TRINITY_DN8792_c0_g1_i2:41-697(+)